VLHDSAISLNLYREDTSLKEQHHAGDPKTATDKNHAGDSET